MSEAITKQGPNPLTLIQEALAKGVGPEELKQYMDLRDRWVSEQAQAAYSQAMNRCQLEMPVIVRSALNTHTQKKYAPLEDVSEKIRPVYTAHGFSLSFGTLPDAKDGYIRIYCDVRHTGGWKERHASDFALDGTGLKGGSNMTAIQGQGSTISYARRYLTLMIFNVSIANEDKDGNAVGLIPIGPEQLAELETIISSRDVDAQKFLEFMNVKSLADMPSRDFLKAKGALHRKPLKKAGVA